jgi:excisionase family DNA binding protein
LAYTVDEVSDLMGVPRPTLYRYLREYSIPHLRRSGKIYVPEDSFDRIKEVRELHKEGLGTESVRKRLQGESHLDVEGLAERLDCISESLEELRGNPRPSNGTYCAQVLQTILKRQSLLISAVFNLAEMIEELLHTHGNGRAREESSGTSEEETQEQEPPSDSFEEPLVTAENRVTADDPVSAISPEPALSPSTPIRRGQFGAMGKRRRRVALALLLALLSSTALTVYALSKEGSETPQEGIPEPSLEAPIDSQEVTAERSDTAPSAPGGHGEEDEPVGYAEAGYEGAAPQQPLYQAQFAAPRALPQEQPVLQPQLQRQIAGAQPSP